MEEVEAVFSQPKIPSCDLRPLKSAQDNWLVGSTFLAGHHTRGGRLFSLGCVHLRSVYIGQIDVVVRGLCHS